MKSKLAVYFFIPLLVSVMLNAMYFSENLVLQRIVSPKLPPLSLDSWREFGLLENLQNLLLLTILAMAILGAVRARTLLLRVGYVLLSFGTVFFFLEEIDYGMHFYRYATSPHEFNWFTPAGEWPEEIVNEMDWDTEPFNLHNRADITDILKGLAVLVLVGGFVIFPFIAHRIAHPLAEYIAPDKWCIALLAVMVITHYVTHEWADVVHEQFESGKRSVELGSMNKNLSEFRELLTYYLFAVYLGNVVFFRRYPVDSQKITSVTD